MTFMIHFGISELILTRYEARRFTAVAVNRGTATLIHLYRAKKMPLFQ